MNSELPANPPTILVVDDSPSDYEMYVRYLNKSRPNAYRTKFFSAGRHVFSSVEERPHCLLLDLSLPDMSGLDILRKLKEQNRGALPFPVVMVTGSGDASTGQKAVKLGAQDYLVKEEINQESLVRAIEFASTRFKLEQQVRAGEERARLLAESMRLAADAAGLGFWSWDTRTGEITTDINNRRTLGWPMAGAVHYEDFLRAVLPEDRPSLETAIGTCLKTGGGYDEEFRVIHPDGSMRWVAARGSVVRDPSGLIFGMTGISIDITPRKHAELIILENEARFRAMFHGAATPMAMMLPDCTIVQSNRAFFDTLGYTEQEMLGKEFLDFTHPEDRQASQEGYRRLLAREVTSFRAEKRYVKKNGDVVWFDTSIAVIANPDGTISGLVKQSYDISERKQAEEKLIENEARLRLAHKAARSGAWEWDLGLEQIIWSPEVESLYGLAPGSFSGEMEEWRRTVHPDDLARIERILPQILESPGDFHLEFRITRADGQMRWIEATGQVLQPGKAARLVGVNTDITERKQREERERVITQEAISANAKFRAVFEQTTVFAGIMALDGTILEANKTSLEASGYTADDIMGRYFWEAGWWQDSPQMQEKIRTATLEAAQGTPYREILTCRWADGSKRIVDFALHPIRDENGKIIYLHPTGVDITDLKRTQENYRKLAETLDVEVQARTQELEARNAEVLRQAEELRDLSGRLLQTQDDERRRIARELHDSAGQILAALGMTLESMAHHRENNPAKFAEESAESRRLVRQLSTEIRTMSYLLHPPLLEESGLPEALSWYAKGIAERSGLTINLNISEGLNRLPREMELVIFRLAQECLTNIHRHSGSQTASIKIIREHESVSLEIQDQGKGISPHKLAEIQSQGSGVGIRGMRERIRPFGGEMNIESGPSGTKISFKFSLRNTSPTNPGTTLSQNTSEGLCA